MTKKLLLEDLHKVRLMLDTVGLYYPSGQATLKIRNKNYDYISHLCYSNSEARDKDLARLDVAIEQSVAVEQNINHQ